MFFLGGLGGIIYISVLFANAIVILSEDRFLARLGFSSSSQQPEFGQQVDTQSIGARVFNIFISIRTVAKIPLIFINSAIIIYAILFG